MKILGSYYTFAVEPKGGLYRDLLSSAASFATYAQLVIRHPATLSARMRTALKDLQPFFIEQKELSEWPGTMLLNSTAAVYRYQLEPGCIQTLRRLANALYEWRQPELPEDLSFHRKDGSPWFGSISHEKDSFFILSDEEYLRLVEQFPVFLPIIKKDENIVGKY